MLISFTKGDLLNKFIHLHVHSHYSLSNGLNDLDEIIKCAKKQNFTSIALTDQSNLFAMVKFYQAAHKKSIKPILGCHVQVYKENIDITEGFKNSQYDDLNVIYVNPTMCFLSYSPNHLGMIMFLVNHLILVCDHTTISPT